MIRSAKEVRNLRVRAIQKIKLDELIAEFDGKCFWCDCKVVRHYHVNSGPKRANAATRDHVVPLKAGGTNSRDNIVLACHRCNSEVLARFDNTLVKIAEGKWSKR